MRKIIHDCDNTFGVAGCDVDDGLALTYLLGDPDAEVLGVTSTYGNNKVDVVFENTKRMLKALGRTDIPVHKGGASCGDYKSDAAKYLADMAEEYAGELEILATGSLTNLYGAYIYNKNFFKQIKKFVLMGGITEPLIFAKKQMDELNFSCDPLATYTVLTEGKDVAIATGNNCLKVLFTREEYEREFSDPNKGIVDFIKKETDYWFDYNWDVYGIPGYYNWDVVAATYLMHPELFIPHRIDMQISQGALKTGNLTVCGAGMEKNCTLDLPEIGEPTPFTKNIYHTWMKVAMPGDFV